MIANKSASRHLSKNHYQYGSGFLSNGFEFYADFTICQPSSRNGSAFLYFNSCVSVPLVIFTNSFRPYASVFTTVALFLDSAVFTADCCAALASDFNSSSSFATCGCSFGNVSATAEDRLFHFSQ